MRDITPQDIPIKHGRYINARGQTCTVIDIHGEGALHEMLCTKFVQAWRAAN